MCKKDTLQVDFIIEKVCAVSTSKGAQQQWEPWEREKGSEKTLSLSLPRAMRENEQHGQQTLKRNKCVKVKSWVVCVVFFGV